MITYRTLRRNRVQVQLIVVAFIFICIWNAWWSLDLEFFRAEIQKGEKRQFQRSIHEPAVLKIGVLGNFEPKEPPRENYPGTSYLSTYQKFVKIKNCKV